MWPQTVGFYFSSPLGTGWSFGFMQSNVPTDLQKKALLFLTLNRLLVQGLTKSVSVIKRFLGFYYLCGPKVKRQCTADSEPQESKQVPQSVVFWHGVGAVSGGLSPAGGFFKCPGIPMCPFSQAPKVLMFCGRGPTFSVLWPCLSSRPQSLGYSQKCWL